MTRKSYTLCPPPDPAGAARLGLRRLARADRLVRRGIAAHGGDGGRVLLGLRGAAMTIDTRDRGCQNPSCWATWVEGAETHACAVEPPKVTRPTPIHPAVFSAADLDAWLEQRIEQEAPAVLDSETIGHIGWQSHKAAEARYGTLVTIRELIEAWVAEERDARPDPAEAWDRLKAAGYDELDLRRAAGDR